MTTQLEVSRAAPLAALDPLIEVHQLSKRYAGDVQALDGISFDVAAGEVFGLLGPNGAGKSTTVGILTTTIAPSGGTVRLGGYDVTSDALAARSLSSVVFQESVVDQSLTGRAHLMLHARLWAVPSSDAVARIDEVAHALGLDELVDRTLRGYSGGERRRLEIARALISRPRVLFLDEPTVGLDPRIRHELLDLIAGLRAREQLTVLLTTHYLDEARTLCDRVAIINRGRIVALDTPDGLLAGVGEEVLEVRVAGDGAAALHALGRLGVATEGAFAIGSTLTLPTRDVPPADLLSELERAHVAVLTFGSRQPTLDDVYLQLTGDGLPNTD